MTTGGAKTSSGGTPLRSRRLHAATVGTTLLLLASAPFALASCNSNSRSVAAVCHVWDTQALKLHNEYTTTDRKINDGQATAVLGGIVDLFAFPNQMATLLQNMANVAPTTVEPDFQSLAKLFQQDAQLETQAATDPLGAAAGRIISALSATDNYNVVNNYLTNHCGIPR